MFDARFQLALDVDGESGRKESEYANADYVDADTDLIPGTYEGGLKSWEGGLDLIEVMRSVGDVAEWVGGSRVLEVGVWVTMLMKGRLWNWSSFCFLAERSAQDKAEGPDDIAFAGL